MNWYNDPLYNTEKTTVAEAMVNFAKIDQPIVEKTYSIPFSLDEARQVLNNYLDYVSSSQKEWISSHESGWLKDPHFAYIVTKMSAGDSTYNYTKKGLRDRVWVYLAGLKSLYNNNNTMYKWYKPYSFTPPAEKKEIPPAQPSPLPPNLPAEESNKKILAIAGIAAVVVITKMMDLW